MSYRRTYTGQVHYSGSVSYPASESGGSKSYSGTIPVYITIDVDTNDFDRSVANCNSSVNGLTAAVVATEAAQVSAKVEASKKVAGSIIKGFFDYVGADLAQKIKELASRCEATFMELMDQKKTCLSKTTQMQDDYQRITKRYAKLFEDLDKEVVSRIEQMDRPTFRFADVAQSVVDRSTNSELLGLSTVSANENLQLETVLACSHVKRQAGNLIAGANEYLKGTYRLTSAVRDMLSEEKEDACLHLPVLYMESVNPDKHNASSIYGADSRFAPSGEAVESKLRSRFVSGKMEWTDMPSDERDSIMSYLNSMLQSGQLDDRVHKTIAGLMEVQNIQTIK